MGRPRTKGYVEAREAVVVIVGAKAAVYDTFETTDRLGNKVRMNKDFPREEAVEGLPYTFKPGERVRRDHPAVQTCPGAFREIDESEPVPA